MFNLKKNVKITKNNDLSIYDKTPIENYGKNLLKKMMNNNFLNKKRKDNKIIEFLPRNNRNGLGFDPKECNINNNQEKIQDENSEKNIDTLKNNKNIFINKNENKSINNNRNNHSNKNQNNININKDKVKIEWLKQGIIVRIIDENSKYYKTKAIVEDILNEKDFSLLMNDNTINIDFSEEDLETVIPNIGEKVLILDKNQKGKLIERNKKENKVIVQIFNDLSLVELTQDDICSILN